MKLSDLKGEVRLVGSGEVIKPAGPSNFSVLNPQAEPIIGAIKGAGSTLLNASEMGQDVANQTAGRIVNAIRGNGFKPLDISGDQIPGARDAVTPQGLGQQLGFGGEQFAEYFAPALKAANAEKAVSLLFKGAGVLNATARIAGKAATQGIAAGGVNLLQTKSPKEAAKTAATAGVFRGGLAVIGEGARAFHLPERIYSTIFKNSARDMITELKSSGLEAIQRKNPEKFADLVNKGIIKVSPEGYPVLNDTLAEQAIQKGLTGTIRQMANTVVEGALDSEDKVQKIAKQYQGTVSLPEKQIKNVLTKIAQDYEDVGFGEISDEAKRLVALLDEGVPSIQNNPAKLLPQGTGKVVNATPIKLGASRFTIPEGLLPEVKVNPLSRMETTAPDLALNPVSKQGAPAARSLNYGEVSGDTALAIRRLLDKTRIATSFDKPASALSQTQSNLKTLADTVRARLNAIPGMQKTMDNYAFNIDALEALAREAARRGNNQVISLIDSLFLSGGLQNGNLTAGAIGTLRKLFLTGPGVTYSAQAIKNSNASPLLSGLLGGGSSGVQSLLPNQGQPAQ